MQRLTLEQKRSMTVSELEAVLREIVAQFDWATFFQRVNPVWIKRKEVTKPILFLLPDFPCPCGGTFFVNVEQVAMPHEDHQPDCPFRESWSCARRHYFQVLINTYRHPMSHKCLEFRAEFRIPLLHCRHVSIMVPFAIVED